MKKSGRVLSWLLTTTYFFICGTNLFAVTAYAYIDPSAVTYVIQAVAGVLIAVGACLTIFRHKIAAFFKKGKGGAEKKEIHFTDDEEKASEEADADDGNDA